MAKRLTDAEKARRAAEKAEKAGQRILLRELKTQARETIDARLKNDLLYLTNVRTAELEEAVQALANKRAEIKQAKLTEKERLRAIAKADLAQVKNLYL